MDRKTRYRLRVENCVGTIMDIHESLCPEYESLEFLSHFRDLREAIYGLDMDVICEGDVLMVEQATNALLADFRSLFQSGDFSVVYARPLN